MITESFDQLTDAIIGRQLNPAAPAVEACIITFSQVIEKFVVENYDCEEIGKCYSACGNTPVYRINYHGKQYGFFKSFVGAPACVGTIEDTYDVMYTKKFILFGGAGCLNKEIAHGRVMVPTAAYRDEGTSYHYAPAADYIEMPNADKVAAFMEDAGLPYVKGKTWTTDAIFRETRGNFEKHKADGCISVEMESAAVQAMCDFRGLEFYAFFTSGDLLDAPKWDSRRKEGDPTGTQHDVGHFDIAIGLAEYLAE